MATDASAVSRIIQSTDALR